MQTSDVIVAMRRLNYMKKMNKSRLSLVFSRLLFGLVFVGGMGFVGAANTINAPAIAQTSADSDAQNPLIPEKFEQLLKKVLNILVLILQP